MPREMSLHLTAPPVGFAGLAGILAPREAELRQITARNIARGGGESTGLKNQKEEMRAALQHGTGLRSLATGSGEKRILLSIYLEDLGGQGAESWLPPFDASVCQLLLGNSGKPWHAARRRQAAHLFFAHYGQERLAGIEALAMRLREAYSEPGDGPWHTLHASLFRADGVAAAVKMARQDETAAALVGRLEVPENSAFAQALRRELLLQRLQHLPLTEDPSELLAQINDQRSLLAGGGLLLGAAALQVMVRRAQGNGDTWTTKWAGWVERLACHPDRKQRNEWRSFWGWAEENDLRTARKACLQAHLDFFLNYLSDTLSGTSDRAEKWEPRRHFLQDLLFKRDRIISARLVLHAATYRRLAARLRDADHVAELKGLNDGTSVIVLRCVDGISIIGGTHDFGWRLFKDRFPIGSFWTRPSRSYHIRDLRVSPDACDKYLVNSRSGRWIDDFYLWVGRRHGIYWPR